MQRTTTIELDFTANEKMTRAQQLLNCGFSLILEPRTTDGKTISQLTSIKTYTAEEANQFVLLLQAITGNTSNIFFVQESRRNQGSYRLVVALDKINEATLTDMETHKQTLLVELTNFMEKITPEESKHLYRCILQDETLCLKATDYHFRADLQNWTDATLEENIKETLKTHCTQHGINIQSNDTLSDMERSILNTQYAPNNCSSISKANPNVIKWHMSPLYLALIKIMYATKRMTLELTSTDYVTDYTRQLGKGTFATVYHVTLKNGQHAAIKLSKSNTAESYNSLQQEKNIFAFLHKAMASSENKHSGMNNIISYFGFTDKGITGCFGLILELSTDGSLKEKLFSPTHSRLSAKEKRAITCDIAKGLHCLHHYQIIYCDMKPDNILLFKNTTENVLHAKLSDMGLSHKKSIEQNCCGSPSYSAPETLTNTRQDEKSDIFSLGVTFWEIFAEREIYAARPKITTFNRLVDYVVNQGKRAEIPKHCPVKLANMINRFWHQNPNMRPDASQCEAALNELTEQDWDNSSNNGSNNNKKC